MKFSTEYGYLIKALREYPFEKQINDRCDELKYPIRAEDINAGITAKYHENNPKALLDMIKIESDPVLHKYMLYKQAIETTKKVTPEQEWKLISDVYIYKICNVDRAAYKYFGKGKDFAYDKVIKPIFADIERHIYEISASSKFSFKFSEN